MPYIKPSNRDWVLEIAGVAHWKSFAALSPGDFHYLIAVLVIRWMNQQFALQDKLSYANRSMVRGMLQDVVDEFYRQVIAPYEDTKKAENGDVYASLKSTK